jgi:ligand-binding SRPBCC domain-containing protein
MPVFDTSITLDCSLNQAFEFLLRPANIALIAPPDLGLAFTDAPEVLSLGTRFEFKMQAFGQVQTVLHEITQFEPDRQITETQIKGTLGHWVHDHLFETNEQGQVVLIDRIDFNPPPGMLGLLVTANKILDQLDDGYYYRHRQLRKLLSAPQ